MPAERENFSVIPESDVRLLADVGVVARGYDIDGNQLRAYYDSDNNLLFVVDGTINERKPNVLLVMNPVDGRKWDDVLGTDWNIDLEIVRPRKDNKYQKLDIEYGGLDYYKSLIRAADKNQNLAEILDGFYAWRDGVVRRIATERMESAESVAERANETIAKTDETISGLRAQVKDLRDKWTEYKRSVGREPTKQSAAKIFRAESKMDAINDKIARAKKRVTNAKRRLAAAENDIATSRALLDVLSQADDNNKHQDVAIMDVPQTPTSVPQFKEITNEQKAENMAEEEVKPLLDKDPEILDDNIAFKPIEWGENVPQSSGDAGNADIVPVAENVEQNVAPAPLSFTPPQATTNDFGPIEDVPSMQSVLDSMRPVADETPVVENVEQNVPAAADANRVDGMPAADALAYAAADAPNVQMPNDNNADVNVLPSQQQPVPEPARMPEISVATSASGFRPVSPISGNGAGVQPVATSVQQKSKLVYYVLLVLLIILSIFVLWQYQNRTAGNIPSLETTTGAAAETDKQSAGSPDLGENSPFIGVAATSKKSVPNIAKDAEQPEETPEQDTVVAESEVADDAEQEVVVANDTVVVPAASSDSELEVEIFAQPVPEPQETSVVPDGAVVADSDAVVVEPLSDTVEMSADSAEPQPEETEEEIVGVESPFIVPVVQEEEPEPVVVDKPEYNVSQNEKMFVADSEYETDTVVPDDDTANQELPLCQDGSEPDENGCCSGEVFTDMENGTFACCPPIEGAECFSPIR